jgi:hypothetical protein
MIIRTYYEGSTVVYHSKYLVLYIYVNDCSHLDDKSQLDNIRSFCGSLRFDLRHAEVPKPCPVLIDCTRDG